MPIRPFLADQAFDPEVITAMSLALERVCDARASRRSTTLPLGWSPRRSSNRRSGEYETQILSCLWFSRIYSPMGSNWLRRAISGGEAVGG